MKKSTIKYKETPPHQLSEIVIPLLQWYDCHARILPWRENPEPYAVWISEIMLQQTRVEAVKPYFDRFMKEFPTLSSLSNASEDDVLKLWEGLGYYSRIRNIHKAAKIIIDLHGGQLPASYEALRSLPGIGEYTAGAIGSIAFQLPVPCVDGNVLRIITRITAVNSDITSSAVKRELTECISKIIPKDRPGDFNQAMMELGATICLPNGLPKCEACPVSPLCEAYRQGRMMDFPAKKPKQPRKIEEKTVLILLSENKVALRKRPEKGLLAGLWEFPNFPGNLSEQEVRCMLSGLELSPVSLRSLKKAKHIFTHIEWKMTGYLIFVKALEGKAFRWIDAEVLQSQLTLPSAFKPYYQAMLCVTRNDWREK